MVDTEPGEYDSQTSACEQAPPRESEQTDEPPSHPPETGTAAYC